MAEDRHISIVLRVKGKVRLSWTGRENDGALCKCALALCAVLLAGSLLLGATPAVSGWLLEIKVVVALVALCAPTRWLLPFPRPSARRPGSGDSSREAEPEGSPPLAASSVTKPREGEYSVGGGNAGT